MPAACPDRRAFPATSPGTASRPGHQNPQVSGWITAGRPAIRARAPPRAPRVSPGKPKARCARPGRTRWNPVGFVWLTIRVRPWLRSMSLG